MGVQHLLERSMRAKPVAAMLTADQKIMALNAIAQGLIDDTRNILDQNQADVYQARNKLSKVMLDRLSLTRERILQMANGVKSLAELDDPIGEIISTHIHPNGMQINKVRVPIGVVAIIYESRPNVTADAAALCIKSGNVCVLRGGKEAFYTNVAISNCMRLSLAKSGLCIDLVQLVPGKTRDSATDLMYARGMVDLLIPRGGAGLIRECIDNATVPCIETGTGINHIYVDKSAELDTAVKIIVNAKTSRPSVCNSAEVCLVHKEVAKEFLPMLKAAMDSEHTQLRLCEKSLQIIDGQKAQAKDYDTEFLDYIMAVKIVDDIDEAISHIAAHSTAHSEAILAQNRLASSYFCQHVDSAAVYVNASTRFTDGGEFGLKCEMGISTQKLGVRGPIGLKELTSYKYIINGNGQIR